MASWINRDELEYITPDGETAVIQANEITPESKFQIGLAVYTGEQLLAIRPEA